MIDYRIYGLYRYFQWRLKCNPKNWYAEMMVEKYGMIVSMQKLVNDIARRENILKEKIQQNKESEQKRIQQYTLTLRFDLPDLKQEFIDWWKVDGICAFLRDLEKSQGLYADSMYDKEKNELFISSD